MWGRRIHQTGTRTNNYVVVYCLTSSMTYLYRITGYIAHHLDGTTTGGSCFQFYSSSCILNYITAQSMHDILISPCYTYGPLYGGSVMIATVTTSYDKKGQTLRALSTS